MFTLLNVFIIHDALNTGLLKPKGNSSSNFRARFHQLTHEKTSAFHAYDITHACSSYDDLPSAPDLVEGSTLMLTATF